MLQLANGEKVSFFVDRGLIDHRDNRDYLRVTLVNSTPDKELVLLPTEAFETASPWAEVAVQ